MYEPIQVKQIQGDEGNETVRLEVTLSRGDQIRILTKGEMRAITVDEFRPGVGGRVVLMFSDGNKICARGEFEDDEGRVEGDTVQAWRDKEDLDDIGCESPGVEIELDAMFDACKHGKTTFVEMAAKMDLAAKAIKEASDGQEPTRG